MATTYDPLDAVSPLVWEPHDDTALLEACWRGDLATVDERLTCGVSTEGFDGAGFRPLHVACAAGHVVIVAHLLAAGAHIEGTSCHPGCFTGQRPLHAAVGGGHLDVVELLLVRGAKVDPVDETGLTPLHIAVMRGDLPVVRALLKAGADPAREAADTSPVTLAIRGGHRGVAALLRQCAHAGRLRAD